MAALSADVTLALITGALAMILSAVAIIVGRVNVRDMDTIINALRAELADVKLDLAEGHADNADLKAWAAALVCQVVEAGVKPVEFVRGVSRSAAVRRNSRPWLPRTKE